MKRFILGVTAAAMLSMPMAASALEKMDNSELKLATGQAGVSIAVDDIVIYQKSLADVTYWDSDGLEITSANAAGGATNAKTSNVGKVGIMMDRQDTMEKLITIDAVLNDAKYGTDIMRAKFGDDFFTLHAKGQEMDTFLAAEYDPTNAPNVTWEEAIKNDATLQNLLVDKIDGLDDAANITDEHWASIAGQLILKGAAKQKMIDTNYIGMNIGILNQTELAAKFADMNTNGYNPTTGQTGDFTNAISPLTIDVGTCKALTEGWDYNTSGTGSMDHPDLGTVSGDVAGVVIGLPTVEITQYYTDDTTTVKLLASKGNEDKSMNIHIHEDGKVYGEFIEIQKTGVSQMAILGGRLEIAPH